MFGQFGQVDIALVFEAGRFLWKVYSWILGPVKFGRSVVNYFTTSSKVNIPLKNSTTFCVTGSNDKKNRCMLRVKQQVQKRLELFRV